MIFTSFVLAALVLAGFIVLFKKLPPWLQRFISKRYIIADIILCWLAFQLLGFALIGIFAAGFISLFVSIYLYAVKKTGYKKWIS